MKETIRQQLIRQLREALHQAESPYTEIAEFDILDTEFSIDFSEDERPRTEARLHIRNELHMVEFPDTEKGMKDAKQYRIDHKDFKGRHIQKVLQCKPSEIEIGKRYVWT
jgi:hypothetical protein